MLDNRGRISIKAVIWTLVLLSLVYGSIKLVPMYFTYIMMHYEVGAEVKQAHLFTDQQLLKHIMDKAENWELPIDPERVKIARGYDHIDIKLRYNVEKSFFAGRKTHVFMFVVEKDGDIKSEDYR